ncbi:MAG TPA: hypothetical protein VKU00_04365 [Chthonomonadaceae bacterium]|nr:hypothetical protein [Chthonomonadaceae bacterium]
MFGMLFKLFGFAISLVLLIYLAANAFRKARRLDTRIREFKAEQEALSKQSGPINPYAALAELYTEQAQEEAQRRRGRKSGR